MSEPLDPFTAALIRPVLPTDPSRIALARIVEYLTSEDREAVLCRMFGLPADAPREGFFPDDVIAMCFLACIQPALGALPWNRHTADPLAWVAFPAYNDPRFAVQES